MEHRTITVKGTATVRKKPDTVVIRLTLNGRDKKYDRAVQSADEQIGAIRGALAAVGFQKDDLKTASFNVNTEYDHVHDENGNYTRVFIGYACTHELTLTLAFEPALLSRTLSALTEVRADPELSVNFTVRDPSAVSAELLAAAAKNAKEKADLLCAASGVTRGELLTIRYDWVDIDFRSETMLNDGMPVAKCSMADFTPQDIEVSDSAAFVWEIR